RLAARVLMTASVCGCSEESRAMGSSACLRLTRLTNVIASAAAVLSSSSEEFAVGKPVRSAIMVWKFNKASRRPWEISGWYGVYAVYQPGSSSTLRRITGGVTVGG